MTQYPEIALARELGMRYVNISVITEYDAGLEGDHGIAPALVRDAISHAVRAAPDTRTCRCAEYAMGPKMPPVGIAYVSNGHYLEAIAHFYMMSRDNLTLSCVAPAGISSRSWTSVCRRRWRQWIPASTFHYDGAGTC